MKIQSMQIDNFAGISHFSATFNDGVNVIYGGNGSGKSTAGITAIWSCLQGIAEKNTNGTQVLKGKRLMFVGNSADEAEITIVLTDGTDQYKIRREIAANRLEITSTTGKKLDQAWLNSFFSEMMLSPIAFSRLSPKEQADYLGIDTSAWDARIDELKEDATILRREIKSFGEVEVPEKTEPVDLASLYADRDAIMKFNQKQKDAAKDIELASQRVSACESEVERLMEALQIAQVALENRKKELERLPVPEPELSAELVDQKISAASETNALAMAYEAAVKKQEGKGKKESELAENLSWQKEEEAKKTAYLQSLDLPATNLTIDDKGGLMFDGRPIATPHLSHSELVKVCTQLIAPKNENFKYVFLEDFDVFDDKKGREMLDWLLERGYQVLAEKVNKKGGDLVVLQDL